MCEFFELIPFFGVFDNGIIRIAISRRKFIAADMEVISKGMFGSPRVGRIIRRASNVETTAANANPKIPKEASISLFK